MFAVVHGVSAVLMPREAKLINRTFGKRAYCTEDGKKLGMDAKQCAGWSWEARMQSDVLSAACWTEMLCPVCWVAFAPRDLLGMSWTQAITVMMMMMFFFSFIHVLIVSTIKDTESSASR